MRALLSTALFSLLAACASRPSVPAVSAPQGPQRHGVPVFFRGEVARFHVPDEPGTAFTVRPDDVLVVAQPGREQTWTIEALDRTLTRQWSVPLHGSLRGLESFADGRVLAMMATESFADLQATVLGTAGETIASTSFTSLLGTACKTGNRWWLARRADAIVAQVVCGDQWVSVELDSSLHVRQRSSSVTYGPMWIPQTWVDDRGPELALVRPGSRESLGPNRATKTVAFPSLAPLGDDVIAARSLNEWLDDSTRPRFAVHGVVSRHGAHPWSVDLVPAHTSNDVTTIGDVETTADGTVLVALEYGGDGRVSDAVLPLPQPTPDVRFPGLTRYYAVAELDGATGMVRRALALQPRKGWRVTPFARVAATKDHVVVASGDDIVVFARNADEPGPMRGGGTAKAIPVASDIGGIDASRVSTSLAATWASVCGPRAVPAKPSPCRIESISVGKDGTVAMAGGYYNANQLGATKLPARAYEAGVVAVIAPDGTLRWHKTWGASWHNAASRVLVRDDGAVVVIAEHGQHFSLDGRALPDRVVQKVQGQDMDYTAISPFIAVFDAAGTLMVLEDVDALVYGDRSTDPTRVCSAEIAQGRPDASVWLRADCGADVRRIRLRGSTFEAPETVGPTPGESWPRSITGTGRLLAGYTDLTTTWLLEDDGAHPRQVEALAGRGLQRFVASADGVTWLASTVSRMRGSAFTTSLQVARIDGQDRVTTHELVAAPNARIDGMTTDESGRAIVSITFDGTLTLAGHTFAGTSEPAGAPPRGRVLVRLTADGSAIDRLVALAGPRGGCVVPGIGALTSMSARGDRVALTMSFGVTATCKVKDEPSIALVVDL